MAMKGLDVLIKVNVGTAEVPEYVAVGAQRGASLSMSSETLDKTSKDSDGWQESLSGLKSWSISTDGLLILDDAGYMALEDAYMASKNVLVQFSTKSGAIYEGDAIITTIDLDAPYDDLASYSAEFQGSGALKKK